MFKNKIKRYGKPLITIAIGLGIVTQVLKLPKETIEFAVGLALFFIWIVWWADMID